MQLLIDWGNSRIKWALLQQGVLQPGGQAHYSDQSLESLFERWWGELPTPEAICAASVVASPLQARLGQWCQSRWQRTPTWLQAVARQLGVSNAYPEPQTLGADRWAALIGARQLGSQPLGIIDCGSAITIDMLETDGQHRGGYIIPGLWMMQHCLLQGTSRIEASPSLEANLEPGTSTAACLSHGALRSVIALLDQVMAEEPGPGRASRQWLLTGGDAARIQPWLSQPARLLPDLVLQGLACVAQADTPACHEG